MGQGRGWSQIETLNACKAYTAASEDPRRGSGKKKEVFAKQAQVVYDELRAKEKEEREEELNCRTSDAICQRYRKAKCECLKLDGIIQSLLARKPTGSPTESDIERAALAVYNGEANLSHMYTYLRDSSIGVGAEFPYKEAYKYLKTTETWKVLQLSRSKVDAVDRLTTENSPLINCETPIEQVVTDAINASNDAINNGSKNHSESNSVDSRQEKYRRSERPIGNKRLLEQSKQIAVLNRGAMAVEQLAESSRKKARVAEGMLEVERQKGLVDLFSMSGTNPETLARFREVSQKKELKRLERELTIENNTQQTNAIRENSETVDTNDNDINDEPTQTQKNIMNVFTLID